MYKLGFKEAEEPEVRLPTFLDHGDSERISEKTSTSASLTTLKPLTVWITTDCGKETGEPDHLTCLLRNMYAGQEETELDMEKLTEKRVWQGCILAPCLFYFYAEYIMQNARLDQSQVGIKSAGRNIHNLRYTDDTTLMAESEEELKSLFMKVKEI